MPVSKAQMQAVERYNNANYENVRLRVPKGRRAAVEEAARRRGMSVNAMINAMLCWEAGLTMEEWKNVES